MIPKHIEIAVELMQLYKDETSKSITKEGQQRLTDLRKQLLDEVQKFPFPEVKDPFNLL